MLKLMISALMLFAVGTHASADDLITVKRAKPVRETLDVFEATSERLGEGACLLGGIRFWIVRDGCSGLWARLERGHAAGRRGILPVDAFPWSRHHGNGGAGVIGLVTLPGGLLGLAGRRSRSEWLRSRILVTAFRAT